MRSLEREHILLIGGRSKAKALAGSLLRQGYRITVINESEADCVQLAGQESLDVYCGDGTKPYVLDEAGAADCDIAIALTSRDEDNLVACQICKRNFHVKKTVALVSDPEKTEFFEQMGVDRVVCVISAVTAIIQQQALVQDMVSIIPAGVGRAQIAEVRIPADSPAAGKMLWQIALPKEVVIGCILRQERTVIPKGDTPVEAGDTLVVIAAGSQQLEALRILTGR